MSHLPADAGGGWLLAARDRDGAGRQREERQRLRQPWTRAVPPGAPRAGNRSEPGLRAVPWLWRELRYMSTSASPVIKPPCAAWAHALAAGPDDLTTAERGALDAHVATCEACAAA